MARLLVEIDESLKRELKVRLVRDGETLKAWLTRMAKEYVAETATATAPEVRFTRPAAAPAPMPVAPAPRPKRHDDYLD